MLGRLVKYEIKSTARQFIPLYSALLILSIINKVFFSMDIPSSNMELPLIMGMFVYGAVAVAIGVLTCIVTIQRFYKNLLSDEGYLMFTLPVKTWELIVSKLAVAVIWVAAGIAVTSITLLIMAVNTEMIVAIPDAFSALVDMIRSIGLNETLLFVQIIAISILTMIHFIMQIYASISIGHLFSRHRLPASFGSFLALNVIQETLEAVMIWMFIQTGITNQSFDSFMAPAAFTQSMLIPGMISSLIAIFTYFFITNFILSHNLNLE